MPNIYRGKLDIKEVHTAFKPVFVQHDHARLEIELLDGGKPYDLSNVARVEFTHVRKDGVVIIQRGERVTQDGKTLLIYEYQGTEMDFIGEIQTSLATFDAAGKKVSTHGFKVIVEKDLREENFNPAQPNYGKIQQLMDDVEYLKEYGGGTGEGGVIVGPKGKDGYTPVKGIDYFDGKDGKDGKDGINGKDGYTPIKGIDYHDGKDGKDGIGGNYGGKFEWRYNAVTNSLDLVVLD